MTWPALVFWALIITGALSRGPLLLYLFFAAASFGSLQMIPGDAVGGVNLLPQLVCATFLMGKILLGRGNLGRALTLALDPTKLGLLFGFLGYSFFSAYVMPRALYHTVEVIPVSALYEWTVFLEPTMSNLTQSGYLSLSVGMVLAFTLVGDQPRFQNQFFRALLVGAVVIIASGLVDLFLSSIGQAELLAPFRNASYSLLVDDEVLGNKRVVGFLPEASAYGGTCIVFASALVFLRPFLEPGLRDRAAPAVLAGLFVMIGLSTSATAYIGAAVLAFAFSLNWLRRFFSRHPLASRGVYAEALLVTAASSILLLTIAFAPNLLDPASELIDTIIFQKSGSESYIGRNMWTTTAMDAFVATYGAGVGLGSARASNWYVVILSNTGVVGATFLATFFATLLFRTVRHDLRSREMAIALKFSLIPWLIMQALAGTIADFGVGTGAFLGLIGSLTAMGETATATSDTLRSSFDEMR